MTAGSFCWLVAMAHSKSSFQWPGQLDRTSADESRLIDKNPATGNPVAGFFMEPELARLTS